MARLSNMVFLFLLLGTEAYSQSIVRQGVNGIYAIAVDFNKDTLTWPSGEGEVLIELRGGVIQLIGDGNEMVFRFGEFYGYKNNGY